MNEKAAQQSPIRCAVITVSDAHTEETDRSGSFLRGRLSKYGHAITIYHIAPDEPSSVQKVIDGLAGKVDVALINGGTGIGRSDDTCALLAERFETPLPGFGELFRMLSYEAVGARAMDLRAAAGIYSNTLYFAMPGMLDAVKRAAEKLILPELQRLATELVQQRTDG